MTVRGLGREPLRARMSRSSPGRYAVSEFAKNVFSVEAFDGGGKALAETRPNVDEWDVAGHDGTVRLVYKLFGDYADGTYMGVDTTHAHLNMPATFMWVEGRDMQPARFTFTPPAGSKWKIATQLYPTGDPWTFTAPNLQYWMDSPTELADLLFSAFTLPNTDGTESMFRLAAHADASQQDLDELARNVARLAREEMAVYGEFPKYEPGGYTFILDYSTSAIGDGMEHRNSTSISETGLSLRTAAGRAEAMDTIAHEFFHNWNVERIRPAGLEPFDFTRENVTCCLWLAEGFTQYFGELLASRAGFGDPPLDYATALESASGRRVRSAVQMSEYAPFSDAATSIDVTDSSRTFISYYTYGAAIALALDLSVREQSAGHLSLDDYMRLLWQRFGKPGGAAPGLVGRPYTLKDLRTALGDLTGNLKFADEFFDKYVEGRDVADYARLLEPAGYVLRPARPDAGWIGGVGAADLASGRGGARGPGLAIGGRGLRGAPVAFNTPLYDAGIDEGDVVTQIDGQPATVSGWNAISRRKPGDAVKLTVRRRDGATIETTVTVKADPALQVLPIEQAGGTLSDAQRAFRASWLGTRVK